MKPLLTPIRDCEMDSWLYSSMYWGITKDPKEKTNTLESKFARATTMEEVHKIMLDTIKSKLCK